MISGVKYLSWACWPLHIFLRKIYIYNLYPCFNWLVFWDFELHALWAHQLAQFSLVTQSSPTLCDPMIAACQASLSITNTWSSLKLRFIELVMPSSYLILCHPLFLLPSILPASETFPMCQLFAWGGQSTGVSASGSFLPKKIQGWSPLEWTGWIFLQSKGLSRVFSNTTVQKH